MKSNERCNFDYGIIELAYDLSEKFGFLGFDTREENVVEKEEMKIYGYTFDDDYKELELTKAMFTDSGSCNKIKDELLFY